MRAATQKLVDVHLMIENPAAKIDLFADAGAVSSTFIPSPSAMWSRRSPPSKRSGCAAGIAVNPDTAVTLLEEILNLCDYVMVMTVNPGFAGQAFIEFTKKKIEQLAALKDEYGFKIMIDGACSPARVKELSAIGADGFILGTSALFGKDMTYAEALEKLRQGEEY